MQNNLCITFILFSSLLLTISTSLAEPNDDIAIVRQRVLELMIWPSPDAIPSITTAALHYTSTLNSSCYWPDINYADKSIVVWNTATHMDRISTMVQALTMNGSLVKNNTNLRTAIHCALNVWLVNDWQNPNWWFNELDIPMIATSQMLMLSDNLTDFEIEKISQISYRAAWWLHRPTDTGANLLDMLRSQLYRSLATNNITGINQAFSRIWQDIQIVSKTEDGIQSDFSYHFHGLQLLSGSYGIVWVGDVFLYMLCTVNTQYQADQQHLTLFGEFLTKGDAWMIIRNEWDWNVIGRSISRPFNVSIFGTDPDWIRTLAGAIEKIDTKTDLMNFAARLADQPNAPPLLGNKHFYTSDYQIHRRRNWTIAVKMQSVRTQGSECTNGENRKDEHGGQGVLNLYTAGRNDYNFIFPLLDWQAINGITVEHDIPLEPCIESGFRQIKLPFVGGVSDGQYGLAMMDTASHNLTAQRSWHFYDDAVIGLATNLTLRTPTTAWTTLASRLLPTGKISVGFFNSTVITLNDGNYSFAYSPNSTSNVQWIHIDEPNIGYILPLEQQYESIGIQLGTVTGNYNTINIYNHPITARMVTLFINHGQGPYIRDYNYMIVPNVSLESMPTIIKQYTEEQVFACISTKGNFHGTMWPNLKRAAFVLWENVTTTFSCKSPTFELNVELSDAGAYVYSESETNFTLTASHPMHVGGTVKVTVDRVGSGEGCTASAKSDATQTDVVLTLSSDPQLLGISVNVTCNK